MKAGRHWQRGELFVEVPGQVLEIQDIELAWAARFERVARSQARTNPAGMTRPARDPDERAFLEETGQLGPFVESADVDGGVGPLPK